VLAVRIDRPVASARMIGRGALRTTAVAAVVVLVASAGCGTTDKASRETLPPIRTTIAVTTTTSSTVPAGQRFYVIQSGDTLGTIATGFGVTVQSIVDLNGLANPDDIQAGQTIEIPSGLTVVAEIPATSTTVA
jgi:LysM repeat protein